MVTHDISEAISMSDKVIVLTKRPAKIKNIYKMPESIRSLLREAAEKYGDKIVYKYFTAPNEVSEMTYRQLYSYFKSVGSAICSLGLNKKKIAIIGDNSPMWMISLMSIISAGSVAIPLDKDLLPAQVENFLSYSDKSYF